MGAGGSALPEQLWALAAPAHQPAPGQGSAPQQEGTLQVTEGMRLPEVAKSTDSLSGNEGRGEEKQAEQLEGLHACDDGSRSVSSQCRHRSRKSGCKPWNVLC